jgi:hypothetical protein
MDSDDSKNREPLPPQDPANLRPSPGPAADWQAHVRILDREDREALESRPRAGRVLKAGVRVLEDRFARDIFREATPGNEAEFQRRDGTWTDESWRRAWFLAPDQFPAQAAAKLASIRAARERFASAIHQNVLSAKGMPFPSLRVPWWYSILPLEWEPKIRSVEQVANLTEGVVGVLAGRSGSPPGLAWPKPWHDLLAGLNDVRVYAVRRGGKVAFIVAAFVTPVTVQKQSAPAVAPLDQYRVDAVQKTYAAWRQTWSGPPPVFTFMTLGGMECPSADFTVAAAGDYWLLYSCPDSAGRWQTSIPRRFGDRSGIRDFVDCLKPETAPERVSRVKDGVDELIPAGEAITLAMIKSRTGYRKSVVRRAFFVLQDRAGDAYHVYKTKEGQYAIRPARSGEKVSLKAGSFHRSFVRQHGIRLIGAAVGVGGWALRGLFDISGVSGFVLLVLLVYVTSCIQNAINRRADTNLE